MAIKDIAKELEKFGRHGDSELVHLNPVEVEWLKSMSPTGELTTNPDTGLQEAFLPFLAALLPGLMGSGGILSALPGAAMLAAHPILAGAGLGALGSMIEGDNPLEGALTGGLGAGVGKMLGGAGGAAKGGGSIGDKFSANLEKLGGDVTTAVPGNGLSPYIADAAPAIAGPGGGGGIMGWVGSHPLLASAGLGALTSMNRGPGMVEPEQTVYNTPEAFYKRQPQGIDIGRQNWDNYGSTREFDLIDDMDPGQDSIMYR